MFSFLFAEFYVPSIPRFFSIFQSMYSTYRRCFIYSHNTPFHLLASFYNYTMSNFQYIFLVAILTYLLLSLSYILLHHCPLSFWCILQQVCHTGAVAFYLNKTMAHYFYESSYAPPAFELGDIPLFLIAHFTFTRSSRTFFCKKKLQHLFFVSKIIYHSIIITISPIFITFAIVVFYTIYFQL